MNWKLNVLESNMPTYEYQCSACKNAFEKFQQMTARVLKKCPACGERKLVRLIGAGGGIIFKGTGFYCNDYKKTQQSKQKERENRNGEKQERIETPVAPEKPKKKGNSG